MSLTVDAAPPGAPAVSSHGPSARSLPSGIAALFAALLTGKITADAATEKEGDAGAHGKTPPSGKDERRPDDPIVLPPPDPNTLALLVPPMAANVPPAPPNAALTKTTENAMDTVPAAPAPTGPQNDGGLLFPTQTAQANSQTNAPATAALSAAPPSVGPLAPVVTPAAQSVTASAVTPEPSGVASAPVTPDPASAVTPAVTSAVLPPGKPIAAPDKAVPIPAPVVTGPAASGVMPALMGAAPVMSPHTGQATSAANTSPVVTPAVPVSAPQGAGAVLPAAVPNPALVSAAARTVSPAAPQSVPSGTVRGAAKTDATPALRKSLAPANNTGRSLTTVLPAGTTADAAEVMATQVALSEGRFPGDTQEPSEEAGTGPQTEMVPAQASGLAQASTVTLQTAHAAPAKAETGTAARQVAEEVVSLKLTPGAARQVTVNLHPREWGDVRVQVTMAPANADGTAGAVTAHLSADSPQARAALEASSGDLKRALHDAGLRLETLTISATDTVQAASQGKASGNGSPPGQENSQNAFAAFAGTGNHGQGSAASFGGQGGGNRPGGQSGPQAAWTADTDTAIARPETPRTAPTGGVDIRA